MLPKKYFSIYAHCSVGVMSLYRRLMESRKHTIQRLMCFIQINQRCLNFVNMGKSPWEDTVSVSRKALELCMERSLNPLMM